MAVFPHQLDIHGTTDPGVARAIATNAPFPERPGGTIPLGQIAFATPGALPVTFAAAGIAVRAEFSAAIAASVGIYPDAAAAFAALNLGDTAGVDIAIRDDPDTRYALVAASYSAQGSSGATHPLGAIGTVRTDAAAGAAGRLAVVHRFERTAGARSVLARTLDNWMLPRDVASAANLSPGTWVIAEIDGTIAINVAAAVGYTLDFVRTVKAGTLAGDIGLKVDAAVKATFGIDLGGRYLAVVGRETPQDRIRVQLFKLTRKGVLAGVNLTVGAASLETVAPGGADDFVAAVFGVHGAQIVAALQALDSWTDPAQSVGTLVAGLTSDKARDLFAAVTGKDLRTEFDAARAVVVEAIHRWKTLDARVSAALWRLFGRLDDRGVQLLKHGLALLAANEPEAQRQAFEALLRDTGFIGSPLAELLAAFSGRGLLALLGRLEELRPVAAAVIAILDAGVMRKLQRYVERTLNLDAVLAVVTKTDFDALDSWLVGRLAAFFDRSLHFEDLEAIKDAIHLALAQRQKIDGQLAKALNARYAFELAATWQRATGDTALFDVEFDTTRPEDRDLLAALLRRADYNRFLDAPIPGVRVRAGVLSHEVTRKTTVSVSLPHLNLQQQTFNEAWSRVEAEASGGGVLAYEATGTDVVDARNRFRSSLSAGVAAAAATTPASAVVIHSLDGTWSYELRSAKAGMRRLEFEAQTRPFIETFIVSAVVSNSSLPDWYDRVAASVEASLHSRATLGDVCIAFEVAVASAALAAWFRPATPAVQTAAKAMAVAIQAALKRMVSFYYLSETARLETLASAAALLTWAAIPPANALTGDEVIWDWRDAAQLSLMTGLATPHVAAQLPALRLRLQDAHRDAASRFYADGQAASIVATALGPGKPLLDNLLAFERALVVAATAAYADAQAFVRASQASIALERLADFAADITRAFNALTARTVFVGPPFRALAQAVFVEAARALDPAVAVQPSAMLTVWMLAPGHRFDLGTFPAGMVPTRDEVIVTERLVAF